MNLTFDTNAIIDLEENRPAAPALRELVDLHHAGSVCIRLVGISASERQQNSDYAPDFVIFQAKVAQVGLGDLEILKPPFWWDLTYWDWSVCDVAEDSELRAIHAVLFPNSPFEYDAAGSDRRWRNQKCDVLALWSHIHYDGDVFVSRDANFLSPKKQTALAVLGVRRLCSPQEAVEVVRASLPHEGAAEQPHGGDRKGLGQDVGK